MKLRSIIEALNRRGFLQNTSALLGGWKQAFKMLTSNHVSALSNLSKLYGNLDDPSKHVLDLFMSGFANHRLGRGKWSGRGVTYAGDDPKKYLEEYTENGMISSYLLNGRLVLDPPAIQALNKKAGNDVRKPTTDIPVEAIMGKFAWLIDQNSYGAVQILSGSAPENFELISPGIISKALDYSVRKYGVEKFADSLYEMNHEAGIHDDVFNTLELALSNKELSTFVGITPDMVRTAAKTGRGLAKMVDKGLLGKEDIKHWRDFLRRGGHEGRTKNQEKTKEREREKEREKERKHKHEREQAKEKESTPPETYEPRSDDYIYGSSMHQPMENKFCKDLNTVFSMVFG